ncbi:MAG: hypothetical protein LIV24_10420 [Eubacterium sp.]|nr:hypothetical protein [Eubacterium sp.]
MPHLWKRVEYLRNRIRLDRKTFILYSILRILVIITAVRCFLTKNFEGFAICILSLFLFLLPSFFEEKLKLEIPPLFEKIIYLFIYAAEILGEVNHYYTAIPGWDTMLHTINGFLCAAIGFSLVDILNRKSSRLNLSPIYLAVVAFCFSMTIGVIWEFIEFTMDQFFYLDMQKDFIVKAFGSVTLDPTHSQIPVKVSNITKTIIETAGGKQYVINGGYLDIGIIDTMKDLMVNFVGAVVFSIIGYFSVKNRDRKDDGKGGGKKIGENIAEGLRVRTLSDEEVQRQKEEMANQKQDIQQEIQEDRENLKQSIRRNAESVERRIEKGE